MSINDRCYNCMHREYCYARSIAFPERAETCTAYNNIHKRNVVDRNNVKKEWEGKS